MAQYGEIRLQGRTGAAYRLKHVIHSDGTDDEVRGFNPAAAPPGSDEDHGGRFRRQCSWPLFLLKS
jgi:hypothetical protein